MNQWLGRGLVAGSCLLIAACGDTAPAEPTTAAPLEAFLEASWESGNFPGRQTAFSRDGSMLATASAGGEVLIRRAGNWAPVARFEHAGGATAVAFDFDGRRLFTAGYDGVVRIWDLRARRPAGSRAGAQGTIWTLDVSPDGSLLAAAGEDRTIRIWGVDAPGPPIALAGHERNIWEVRFSPDGKRIASASFDASVRLWDARTGAALKTLKGHTEAVVGLAYSPNGAVVASGSDDSTIRLWRAADGAPLRTIRSGNHVYKLAFSRDGRWLASAGRARGGVGTLWHQLTGAGAEASPVRLWRSSDWAMVAALRHPDDAMYVAFSRDGKRLVTSGEDGKFRLWRLSGRR
jgi:WD40 repeat protein